MMYANTREEFEKCEDIFKSNEVSLMYLNFQAHIHKMYSHRVDTWALYSRKERELPTRGSNTNNYCEASMRTTKENQFGRVRTFNLTELLQVICDDSAIYVTKLIDVGNGRDTALKQSKSKYLGKDSKITLEQIVDIGEDTFIIESETSEQKWYTCNMQTGYCTCPVGSTCAPCKHKSAVAKHTGKTYFSVTPSNDPCQRALYHYIAWGRTLEPHMYRNINDPVSEPKVAEFIQKTLHASRTNIKLHESILEDDAAIIGLEHHEYNRDEDEESEEEDEFNAELVKQRLSDAMDDYKNMILKMHDENPQEPKTNNAMMAFTKTLKKSLNCTPLTIQTQMHDFGIGTVAKSRTKHGGVITVNAPALANRTFKIPGRGPAPLGCPLKAQNKRCQLVASQEEDYIARSDKDFRQPINKVHKLAENVNNNETIPRRHTKQ